MFKASRRLLVAVAVISSCALAGPSMAQAGFQRFIDYQNYNWTGAFGSAVPLWDVSNGSALVGDPVCAGAYDVPSASWAGTTFCAHTQVDHMYCSCGSRNGWGGGGDGARYITMTADELW